MFVICAFAVLVHVTIVLSADYNHPCSYFDAPPVYPFNKDGLLGPWFAHQIDDWEGPGNYKEYECFANFQTPDANRNHDLVEVLVNEGQPRLEIIGKMIFDEAGTGRYYYNSTTPGNSNSFDIIATDYINYYIEWLCFDVPGGSSRSYLFIYSKTPLVLPDTQMEINEFLDNAKFNKTTLRTLDILSCPKDLSPTLPIGGGGLLGGLIGLVGGVLKVVTGLVGSVLNIIG